MANVTTDQNVRSTMDPLVRQLQVPAGLDGGFAALHQGFEGIA